MASSLFLLSSSCSSSNVVNTSKGGSMTEIILVLTVSIISIGLLTWIAVMGTRFFKYFAEVVEEILDEQKKNK